MHQARSPIPMYLLQQRYPECYPYGAMVRELLSRAGLLDRVPNMVVVDVTWGRGKFWSCTPRPRLLVGYDIRLLPWVERPDLFRLGPAWSALEDVLEGRVPPPSLVAVDPPWSTGPRRVGKHNDHFRTTGMLGTPRAILLSAASLAERSRAYILAHWRERWVPDGFEIIVEEWWRPSLARASPEYATWWAVLEPA